MVGKRYIFGQSNIEHSEEIKPVAIAIMELWLSKGISQSFSRSVSQFICLSVCQLDSQSVCLSVSQTVSQ